MSTIKQTNQKSKKASKISDKKAIQIEEHSEASLSGEICDATEINMLYSKKCGNNKEQLEFEAENRKDLEQNSQDLSYLYPNLDDPNFIIKIAEKKEFSDTKYDGTIYNVKEYADILANAEYELLPQQAFVKNFLSSQTPYNSLLLFHGLGSGKTCSAIGVCEEMRDYMKQMGINKKIIIVASPNVQDNFKLQLFDERKLKLVDGIWSMKGCLGNKLLKEINPTGMTGLSKEKVVHLVKNLINASYSFQGYVQFSNDIFKKSGRNNDSLESKVKNLQYEYADSLIVIDEVHNIRIAGDNENKNIAKNLMFLASAVSNLRLLLLSATPMFNSYKEIIWLLNLMNMNDRRGIISVSDVFDKQGNFKKDANGKETGKEMLIRKATGYVSYIRGENPYTFPFRVYPDRFAPDNTFKNINEYPKYQINGRRIPDNKKMTKISLFLTLIGNYQGLGYKYIISRLLGRESTVKLTKEGKERKVSAFKTQKSFGYTDLQIPIEALNIIYPYDGLEELVAELPDFEYIDEDEDNMLDISPDNDVKEVVEEIDDVVSTGPKLSPTIEGPTKKKEEIKITEEPKIIEEPKITEEPKINTNTIKKSAKRTIKPTLDDDIDFVIEEQPEIQQPEIQQPEIQQPEINEEEKPVTLSELPSTNNNESKSISSNSLSQTEEKPITLSELPSASNNESKSISSNSLSKTEEKPITLSELPSASNNESKSISSNSLSQTEEKPIMLSELPSASNNNNDSESISSNSLSQSQSNNSFRQTISSDNSKITNSNKKYKHIIEGSTKSHLPSEKVKENAVEESIQLNNTGGSNNKSSTKNKIQLIKKKGGNSNKLMIDPKELTGSLGLKRIMDYIDSKTPALKGLFEYRRGVEKIFQPDNIGKYSAKIKNICESIYNSETDTVSEGIILIYCSYIDAGIIPVALALEEMGFIRHNEKFKTLFKTPPTPTVDARTMKPPIDKKDFKPAKYIMITGDHRISPNNDADIKAITSDDNLTGEKIKVVLISQAGSEGLDFKAIRQIHVLDPWYNMNRLEQIIGRGVRNGSHAALPFEQRNVEIFLYGTILEDAQEEAADLYIYRNAEAKAVNIGKVTRLLKQTAVDCIINHDQTLLTSHNFDELEENRGLKQVLSTHIELDNFQVGDMDNSATCDYMQCEFDCLPNVELDDSMLNVNTYNEKFMLINSDKIIQKIKNLFKMRYFYKKSELIQIINVPKPYPISQIYAALTQIITDNAEHLYDKYGRTGYLVNIGDYYLFQPSELSYKNISIFDRSVPINYKHDSVHFKIKNEAVKPVIDKRHLDEFEIEEELELDGNNKPNKGKPVEEIVPPGKLVLDEMFKNFVIAFETTKVQRGVKNWYELCGLVIRKMLNEDIIPGDSEPEKVDILVKFVIEHLVDSLLLQERIDLLDYLYDNTTFQTQNDNYNKFVPKVKKYLLSKLIMAKGLTGMVMFDGPSRVDNLKIFILKDGKWVLGSPEDKRDLGPAIIQKYNKPYNMNRFVGFIGFETNKKYMVYKVKDIENERSTGFRCDQAGKDKVMDILNDIENDDKYISKVTKDGAFELCVRQEFTLRSYQMQNLDNKTWFLDTESAIINEFEKKEKVKK